MRGSAPILAGMPADSATHGEPLERLATLIAQRNAVDREVAAILGRPALQGHFGEFVASRVFGIALHDSAVQKESDGVFIDGPLAGRSVEIKFYAKREGVLDMKTAEQPDYYLVLTGPRSAAENSRGTTRPWVIESVYLFDGPKLARSVTGKIGVATSVRAHLWEEAEIYPRENPALLRLTQAQRDLLALFRAEAAAP